MAWTDPRAPWRRWHKANKKAQRQAKRMNHGHDRWNRGGRFWYAVVRIKDFRK